MASGSQIKALLNSYADQDNDRFFTVALQVAAKASVLNREPDQYATTR